MTPHEIDEVAIDTLLYAIQQRYQYDFTGYARESLSRRIKEVLKRIELNMVCDLIPRILYDEDMFEIFLSYMSVTITEMFRDPTFFLALKEDVLPTFENKADIKIWHAGCATGEEAYSMAIMLEEAGLLDKSIIYATDYNNRSLAIAKRGIYSRPDLSALNEAYLASGGKHNIADYYQESDGDIKIKESISKKITFSYYNLVSNQSFGNMDLIICRNVMIYFNKDLQATTYTLFKQSSNPSAYLALGSAESIRHTHINDQYKIINLANKIYQLKSTDDKPAASAS